MKEAVIGCDDVTERRRRDVGMQPRLWALGKELVEASRSTWRWEYLQEKERSEALMGWVPI